MFASLTPADILIMLKNIPLAIFTLWTLSTGQIGRWYIFDILRGYYYHCPPFQSPYPTEEEKKRKQNYDKFTHGLKQLKRFQVREGRLSKVYDDAKKPIYIQKGVDVLLAIDMIKLILKGAIQRVIIIACDSDFVPVVRAIREEGATVELYHFTEGAENFFSSRYLMDEVDETLTLSKQLLEKSTII